MARTPYISIILPVYNGEEYISETIESVLGQTYGDFELLIINDGSTDRTATILASYALKDYRIKIISQSNAGVSAARNSGLDVARGEFITFIDADDAIASEFLSRCVSECNGYDIVATDFTRDKAKLNHLSYKSSDVDPIKYLESVLYQRVSSPAVCGKLFRKKLFSDIRFWPYRYEDLEIFPKLVLKSEQIRLLRENLYYYRDNSNSFINSVSLNRFDTLKATESILNFCTAQHNAALNKAARCRWLSASFNAFCISLGSSEFVPFREKSWTNIKKYRKSVFFDINSPVKIKLGIAVSVFGPRTLAFLNRIFKISS